MKVMRGFAELDKRGNVSRGGELVFFFQDDEKRLAEVEGWSLELYREWVKRFPPLEPGKMVPFPRATA